MEFHCDKFSIQCTWLSIIKCLWQVENILKYLTLFKVILICVMTNNQFSSVTQSWLFVTPWTVACQTSLSTTNSGSLLKFMSIESVMHPTISSSVIPFSSCLQSIPASESFQRVNSSHQMAKVLKLQLQPQSSQWIFRTDFLYNGLVGSPCSPRDSQEFSPTPQFKSINSLALSFLHSPTFTSIHDHWKNHSLD